MSDIDELKHVERKKQLTGHNSIVAPYADYVHQIVFFRWLFTKPTT